MGAAFIDLRKGFDTVDHTILIQKIKNVGATDIVVKWFVSYLTERTQKVYFKSTLSDPLPVL